MTITKADATPSPMELAPVEESFSVEGFEAVSVGNCQLAHVGSPLEIRRQGAIDCPGRPYPHSLAWLLGSSRSGLSRSDGQPHHTITPIARIRDGHYELDLVPVTTKPHQSIPMAFIIHHADVQHIKRKISA